MHVNSTIVEVSKYSHGRFTTVVDAVGIDRSIMRAAQSILTS